MIFTSLPRITQSHPPGRMCCSPNKDTDSCADFGNLGDGRTDFLSYVSPSQSPTVSTSSTPTKRRNRTLSGRHGCTKECRCSTGSSPGKPNPLPFRPYGTARNTSTSWVTSSKSRVGKGCNLPWMPHLPRTNSTHDDVLKIYSKVTSPSGVSKRGDASTAEISPSLGSVGIVRRTGASAQFNNGSRSLPPPVVHSLLPKRASLAPPLSKTGAPPPRKKRLYVPLIVVRSGSPPVKLLRSKGSLV